MLIIMESNIATEIAMNDIVTIATLLRDKGDKILNFSCKLSFTVEFLVKLNEAFDLIVDNIETTCFQVINTNNSTIEFLHDLQFLHDFVQKVLGLRLWSKTFDNRIKVNLEKFRSLRILDIYGVPVQTIGLCTTRDKLRSLTCRRTNLRDLKVLLESETLECVDYEEEVRESKRIWSCLEEIFLPHNNIEHLGYSLRYAPSLRVIDFSHNNLMDISSLDHTTQNLEWLNVSYNRLSQLPNLSHCTKLKVLLVSDNWLEGLKGLGQISTLQHVDASRNLIKEHKNLAAVMNLSCLERFQLEGNPIAFKRGHRLLTIARLNPSVVASEIFVLDGIPLSSLEKSRFPVNMTFDSVGNVESGSCSQSLSHQSQCCMERQSDTSSKQPKNLQNMKIEMPTGSRSVRIREAPIAEGEECQLNESLEKQNDVELLAVSGAAVHLETKRDIESLRKAFGEENWLQGGGGLKILDILGIQVGSTISHSSSLPSGSEIPQGELCAEEGMREFRVDGIKVEEEDVDGEADDEEEAVEADDGELLGGRHRSLDESESEVELGVFLVQRKGNKEDVLIMDDLLLVVTERYLVERDAAKGVVVARWDLSRLQGMSKGIEEGNDANRTRVLLTFRGRSGVADLQSYFLDDEEAKELLRILEEILEEMHAITRNSAVQFTCIRCSTDFFDDSPLDVIEIHSVEGRKKSVGDAAAPNCPNCGSAVVVHAVTAEVSESFARTGVLDNSFVTGSTSNTDCASANSEHESLFASWAGSKLSTSMKANSEASDRGLQLHVILNILPDGEGKENEFNIYEALIFQESSEESFHGHIVLSKDSVYILRETLQYERDCSGRRAPSDESSEPVLVEWHLLSNLQSVTHAYSGYIFQFGPQPPSCLWIFPRFLKQMQKMLDTLCRSQLGMPIIQSREEQPKVSAGGLGEIIMTAPLASFSYLSSHNSQGDSDPLTSQIHHGVLVLTSTTIAIMEYKELKFSVTEANYIPSYTKKISDLVGLDAAPNLFLHLPGLIFNFSGEADDDRCIVWTWGDGTLLALVEALRKPWESLFSIPLEAIVVQTSA